MDEDLLSLSAQIVSAHVSGNDVAADQLPTLIKGVYQTLVTVGQAVSKLPEAAPAVSTMKSVFSDHLVCLDCGKNFRTLKRHLLADHKMTPDEYRAKWKLPPSYPLIAPEYAARRSQMAKDSGLGKKAAVEPAQKRRGHPGKGK